MISKGGKKGKKEKILIVSYIFVKPFEIGHGKEGFQVQHTIHTPLNKRLN